MAEELLDRPDIIAILEQMGGERVTQVWQVAGFETPATWTAALTAFWSTDSCR